MKKHLFLKSLLVAIGLLVTSLTTQVWAWGVYYNISGYWFDAGAVVKVHYWWGDDNGDATLTTIGGSWYYAELPAANHNWNLKLHRLNPDNLDQVWNGGHEWYDKNSTFIANQDGDSYSESTTFTAGWHNADPSNNRWVKVYKYGGASTTATSVDAGYTDAVVPGTTVSLHLDEFGAWLWKTRTGDKTYTGGIGKLYLNYRLGKDGGSTGDWHDTYTTVVSSENQSGDGKTWFQSWKWDDDVDLLSNCTTKTNLNSGVYYIEYYWSAEVNRATGHAVYPETIVFNRSGSNYYIKFTIPQPEVTISGRPYVGYESKVTAASVASTIIEGQTVKYKFERYNGSSWVEAQAYSTNTTFVYTPTSATDKVRVIMKVDQTDEESVAVVQDVYEQYYVYVEDTQNWGTMYVLQKKGDTDYRLDRSFPGEQLMACDTVNGKAIFRVILDSYYERFWLSDGTSSKQTFNSGIPINFDQDNGGGSYTYGILKTDEGNWYQVVTDNNANNCYLKDYTDPLYRVVSYDGATGKTYYSNTLHETGVVSFFANTRNGSSTVKIQTWNQNTVGTGAAYLDGSWDTDATNYISSCSSKSATGNVFVATLSPSSLEVTDIYDGDYHIQVFANTQNNLSGGKAKGGVGTRFTHFELNPTIFKDEKFNYYWVDWFTTANISVVATVGNTINTDLANAFISDPYAPYGQTTSGANVRYGYNPSTNYFSRTMIAGSGNEIKIRGARVNANERGYGNEASFNDATAWVYSQAAKVKGKATATVTTSYNGYSQTLADNQQLIGGDEASDKEYTVVVTYDYKTGRLIAAWEPNEEIGYSFSLESNIMLVRTENDAPTLLNITPAGDLRNVSQIYTVLEITQDNWEKSGGNADRRIVTPGLYTDEYYWISLPYECLVSEIFGMENYGSEGNWVLQTYRGDLRAEKGWWAETNAWWYDLDRTDTLKANVGYVLRLTNLNGSYDGTGVTEARFASYGAHGKLSLFFPSHDDLSTNKIAQWTSDTYTTHVDSLKCTKWQKKPKTDSDQTEGENNPIWDRRAIDSNWRIIGSPSFNSTKISSPDFSTSYYDKNGDGWVSQEEMAEAVEAAGGAFGLKYFYNWEVVENEPKFSVANAKTTTFKATQAYLVQYAGDITWQKWDDSNPLVVTQNNPAAAPARHQEEETTEQTLRLVLQQGTREADVAYISRMAYGATMGYDLNMDLSKMTNANSANIYTMGELYKMAGNCISDTVTTLQVGVQLAADGAYTFAIPEGTYGTGIILVDNETGARTNLALTDYTVNLTAGTYDERFELELSPIADVPSDIETLSDEVQGTNVRKVMVDGVLYIVKDGVVYDARGNRVK